MIAYVDGEIYEVYEGEVPEENDDCVGLSGVYLLELKNVTWEVLETWRLFDEKREKERNEFGRG